MVFHQQVFQESADRTLVSMSPNREAILRQQRDRFIGFAFAGGDLLVETDLAGQISYVAGAAQTISGQSEEAMIGKRLTDLVLPELAEIAEDCLVKPGDPIDALSFDLEQQRIIFEFQKRGYADFSLINIDVRGDSTGLEKSWDIFLTVLNNPGGQPHAKFSIGDIEVYTDYHKNQNLDILDESLLFGKSYFKESKDFIVRPSTIDRKILFNKNEIFNSETHYQTIKNLFGLGTYRFAKLNQVKNSQDSSIIDYKILLTPHNSKWIMDIGLDAFFSNISRIQSDLVGIANRISIQDRNFLGGAEKFNSSFEMGIELAPSDLEINSLSIGLNNNVEIPSLTKPLNILRPLHKFGILPDKVFDQMEVAGKSKLALGFNYLDILNFYTIFSINAGYSYDITFNNRHRISFNQIGVNFTSYDVPVGGNFYPTFINDPLLVNSFQNTFFTGFIFKDLTHYYTTERGKSKSNFALISRFKLSGLEIYGLNQLSNVITNNNEAWTLRSTEFEKLAKIELDGRWYNKPRAHSQIAARLRTGIAVPFGDDRTVSFVEQFFVGGPSSIRAWRPMHLGTGSYTAPDFYNPTSTSIFFQRGDIIIDFSLEYRFDVIWYIEGALFLDGGNIWTIEDDQLRPGSKFDFNFYNEIALGYGYGLRFDFNYFLIRFDLGFKLKYPVQPPNESIWISPKGQRFGNFNIAVNYPF